MFPSFATTCILKIATTNSMSTHNRIRELRKEAGISQEVLGAEVGCNKSKISKLENGKQELTQNWMIKLSKALNNHGLITAPSDLLPIHHVHHSKAEREHIETYRTLNEPQRREFESMMSLFKQQYKE